MYVHVYICIYIHISAGIDVMGEIKQLGTDGFRNMILKGPPGVLGAVQSCVMSCTSLYIYIYGPM